VAEFDLAGRHVVVAIPAMDGKVPIDLMISYIKSMELLHRHGVQCTLETKAYCALVDKARTELVHAFLERTDATDFLFVDSDIGWEPADILRLLAWTSEKELVVGMYPVKKDDVHFHAVLDSDAGGKIIQDENGLIKALAVPTGFMMIRRRVFSVLKGHHEELLYSPKKGEFKGKTLCNYFHSLMQDNTLYGEDISFCKRWVAVGGEIWIDPEIKLRHHGAKIYESDYGEYLLSRGLPDE